MRIVNENRALVALSIRHIISKQLFIRDDLIKSKT